MVKSKLVGIASAVVALGALTGMAEADVTSVTVEYQEAYGTFRGRHYVRVEAYVEGTVQREGSTGSYGVPMEFLYATNGSNGVGFVDVPNSATFYLYPELWQPSEVSREGDLLMGGDIVDRGYNYGTVQWDKFILDFHGPDPDPILGRQLVHGFMESPTDEWAVISDCADLLRAGALPNMDASDKVMAFGWSQAGMLIKRRFINGDNDRPGQNVFDGAFLGGAGGMCYDSSIGTPAPCFDVVPDGDTKIIAVDPETDLAVSLAALDRHEASNYRRYELAGVAHLAPDLYDASIVGANRQNPIESGPVVRAAVRNLNWWMRFGVEPPPSKLLDGVFDETEFAFLFNYDADGNVTGGIRLPHMPQTTLTGKAAGAPLGVYGGLDFNFPFDFETLTGNLYAFLAGSFDGFSNAELQSRYTRKGYVKLVTRSALDNLARGYITLEDAANYISDAAYFAFYNL